MENIVRVCRDTVAQKPISYLIRLILDLAGSMT